MCFLCVAERKKSKGQGWGGGGWVLFYREKIRPQQASLFHNDNFKISVERKMKKFQFQLIKGYSLQQDRHRRYCQ